MKPFYITTPLYYVNARPHIGHAYTTIAADILRRYRKNLRGEAVHLLTGTDEHGSKVEAAARAAGKAPLEYAGEISQCFRDLWKRLDVQYDDFIRTTETRHEEGVKAVFKKLHESGDIYKGKYSGFYCVACETFWTGTDLAEARAKAGAAAAGPEGGPAPSSSPPPAAAGGTEGAASPGERCPDCGRGVGRVEEDSYFFALSRYQGRLLALYKERPGFLQPAHRANEILRFVESGLKDLSVSRTKVAWGIRVPFDPDHTVYVWFDALLNYATAAGYPADAAAFAGLWPADVHLVGKEIYRFHAVIWPAMLMALGVEPPRAVFAHGWWTMEGKKMSKSRGNIMTAEEIAGAFGSSGVDTLRYFLFREMPFGNDGSFSLETVRRRYNAELANDLGNLLSRVVTLVDQKLGGELPARPPADRPLLSREAAAETDAVYECMDRLAFSEALNRIWAVVGRLNRHVDREAPWKLSPSDPRLRELMFDLVWCLRIVAGWLEPFMPRASANMQMQLGVRRPSARFTPEEILTGDAGDRVQKGAPLFPRK